VGGGRSFGDTLGCIAKGVFFFCLDGCAGVLGFKKAGALRSVLMFYL